MTCLHRQVGCKKKIIKFNCMTRTQLLYTKVDTLLFELDIHSKNF